MSEPRCKHEKVEFPALREGATFDMMEFVVGENPKQTMVVNPCAKCGLIFWEWREVSATPLIFAQAR